jgi:hypothetical protein
MSSELHPTELLDISSGVPACLYEGIAPFYARGPFDEAEMWQEVVQQTPIPHQMPSVPRVGHYTTHFYLTSTMSESTRLTAIATWNTKTRKLTSFNVAFAELLGVPHEARVSRTRE